VGTSAVIIPVALPGIWQTAAVPRRGSGTRAEIVSGSLPSHYWYRSFWLEEQPCSPPPPSKETAVRVDRLSRSYFALGWCFPFKDLMLHLCVEGKALEGLRIPFAGAVSPIPLYSGGPGPTEKG